jgi:hypothetical protein
MCSLLLQQKSRQSDGAFIQRGSMTMRLGVLKPRQATG